ASFARSWATPPTPASGWQRCAGHHGTGARVSLLPATAVQRPWATSRGPSGSHRGGRRLGHDPDTLVPVVTSLPPAWPCAVSVLPDMLQGWARYGGNAAFWAPGSGAVCLPHLRP